MAGHADKSVQAAIRSLTAAAADVARIRDRITSLCSNAGTSDRQRDHIEEKRVQLAEANKKVEDAVALLNEHGISVTIDERGRVTVDSSSDDDDDDNVVVVAETRGRSAAAAARPSPKKGRTRTPTPKRASPAAKRSTTRPASPTPKRASPAAKRSTTRPAPQFLVDSDSDQERSSKRSHAATEPTSDDDGGSRRHRATPSDATPFEFHPPVASFKNTRDGIADAMEVAKQLHARMCPDAPVPPPAPATSSATSPGTFEELQRQFVEVQGWLDTLRSVFSDRYGGDADSAVAARRTAPPVAPPTPDPERPPAPSPSATPVVADGASDAAQQAAADFRAIRSASVAQVTTNSMQLTSARQFEDELAVEAAVTVNRWACFTVTRTHNTTGNTIVHEVELIPPRLSDGTMPPPSASGFRTVSLTLWNQQWPQGLPSEQNGYWVTVPAAIIKEWANRRTLHVRRPAVATFDKM